MNFEYLFKELKPIFSKQYLQADFIAGFNVALIALPLALAISLASSVAPHMAIISVIVGGVIAAIFGGTRLGITGPALAMTILVADCVTSYGLSGLFIIGLICGILQIIFGVFKLGRFAKLIPLPVVSAFTAGIGFILLIGQLPSAMQLNVPDQNHVFDVIKYLGKYISNMNPMAFVLAIITILLVRNLPRYLPKAPAPLIAILIPTLLVYFFHLHNITKLGVISHNIFNFPHFNPFKAINDWSSLILSALTVFALASFETVLSLSAIDKLTKRQLDNPNQELIGQGLANVSVSLLGGIPVTAVVARSAINIETGAKTRRAAIFHSLIIFAAIYFIPQLFEIIPIAALAGLLLNAAISMLNLRQVREFWRNDKFEFFVYCITFLMIVSTDLINGVQAGMLATFLIVAIRVLTTKSSIRLWANKEVIRISLSGNMTFLSFDKLNKFKEQILSQPTIRFVVFEFDKLQSIDSTGAQHLLEVSEEIVNHNHNVQIILHGLNSEQQKLLNSLNIKQFNYYSTITESEIKQILESHGITHSANDILKQGMEEFHEKYAKGRQELMATLAKEQKPHTLLFTCADSRLNPNEFFSVGLGEIFIVRNVGNVVPVFTHDTKYSEAAAVEFAIGALGIRNVVICAHTECGAVKASIKNPDTSTDSGLDNWLQIIKDGFKKRKPANANEGTKLNLLNQIDNLKTYPLIQELIDKNEITISAWVYDVHSAYMFEWNTDIQEFVSIIPQHDNKEIVQIN